MFLFCHQIPVLPALASDDGSLLFMFFLPEKLGFPMFVKYCSKSTILAQRWRQELLEQRLSAGSPVLSVREFATRYQVAPATADRVFRILAQENYIYRIPKSGAFIKNDPVLLPELGFAGPSPAPDSSSVLYNEAFRQFCQLLSQQQRSLRFIAYHELITPKLAAEKLAGLDGLLLEGCFIDATTLPVLRQFTGKIVVVGYGQILEELSCSQVVPDFRSGLLELQQTFDLRHYEKFLLTSASHQNALNMQTQVYNFFTEINIAPEKIELLEFTTDGSLSAESQALQYFSQHQQNLEKTLIISLSDYFSFGIREAFQNQRRMPDICSIDNLEDFLPALKSEKKYFTTIDKSMPRIYCEAAELILRILNNNDDRKYVIRIPTKLVPRQSMHCPHSGSIK